MLHITIKHPKLKLLVTILAVFSILLGACSSPAPAPTATPEPTPIPAATSAPQPVLESLSQAELMGETWQWVGLRETAPAAQSLIPDPENYTLTFNEDGTVSIKADCNVAMGSYQLSGDQLTISMGPTTLAECGPESSYNQFLTLLEQAAGVGMGYGNLVISLANGAGEMYFQRATTSSLAADLQPVSDADLMDILWQWVSLVETMPASQSMVENSENYNLTFRSDGTYSAKADCNQLMGSYELQGGQLRLEPGISTLAACAPGSSYDLYRNLLEQVAGVGSRDGALVLVLAEDAGIMNFENKGPAPEAAAPQTIEGDPALVLGPPDGTEDFNNENNWTTFDDVCFKSEISGGQFVMTAKGVLQSSCWEVSWPQLDNFYIETTQLMPETCDPQDRFGMLFRAPDNNRGYLYGFDCSGNYNLTIWDGQETTVLVEPTKSDAIFNTPGASNRMGLLAFGENISLYVNGVYLQTVTDYTYLDKGKIGYFVQAASDQPFTVRYDQLRLWALVDEFYPPMATQPLPPVDIPQPPANVPSGEARVNVNVREGPSMFFAVKGIAMQGDTGEILGTSPDGYWYAVKVPTTLVGTGTAWVAADYVNLTNPTGQPLPVITPPLLPPLVSFPAPPQNAPQAIMKEPATLRSGPTLEFPVFGVAPTGSRAEVLGESEDEEWWAVRLPASLAKDETGWVPKLYTSATNVGDVKTIQTPDLPKNITPAAPGSGSPSLVTIEPLNVRNGPGNEFPSLGKVSIGAIMAVVGVSPDREYFVVNVPLEIDQSGRGWVPARYVSAENVSDVPVVQPPPVP
ncbi:MAG: META domain-containing protein [Anaerolineales bacterium]